MKSGKKTESEQDKGKNEFGLSRWNEAFENGAAQAVFTDGTGTAHNLLFPN
jgi:hypothetical protein